MSYNFEIIGIAPVLNFFNYQQESETDPQRSKVFLGSYECTLDAFIQSTQMVPQKPMWNWDEVIQTTINFWLRHGETIDYWKSELKTSTEDNLIVARVANFDVLRHQLENLLSE